MGSKADSCPSLSLSSARTTSHAVARTQPCDVLRNLLRRPRLGPGPKEMELIEKRPPKKLDEDGSSA